MAETMADGHKCEMSQVIHQEIHRLEAHGTGGPYEEVGFACLMICFTIVLLFLLAGLSHIITTHQG